jgi:hypothetical protein
MEAEVREMLQRKAEGVPAHRAVPGSMLKRARRRIALTVSGGVLALILAVAGGYSGVRALRAAETGTPVDRPTPSVAPTGPQPVTWCAGSELAGHVSLEGAAGSAAGSIVVTKETGSACTLTGRPTVRLLDADHHALAVRQDETQAWWEVEGLEAPQGWPVVTLQTGQSARIRTAWSNFCSDRPVVAAWEVVLHEGATLILPPPELTPMCTGPDLPSAIQVGPVEPAG